MEKATQKQSALVHDEKQTMYRILFLIGLCHLLNDSLQAVIPAMFPILERSMGLTFTQLGFIAFTLNMVSSVMQPLVGTYTDKRPLPYALPIGLASSMLGILGLAFAPNFWLILVSVIFIGLGSAVFHPEGSRVVYLAASQKRRGLGQSIYQVGGNSGQALAPVITALILVPLGQRGAIWFTLIAAIAVAILTYVAKWYSREIKIMNERKREIAATTPNKNVSKAIKAAIFILIFITFARSWYIASISNFYAFYVIENYQVTIANSQIYIFIFLALGAIGTFLGGPLADRLGRKNIILYSLVAASPLSIILPHVGPTLAMILLGITGLILMTSFSVVVVYAQELVPGKIGTMSGLMIGLGFGMGAIGSVALGAFIDHIGLNETIMIASVLPLLGLLSLLLPADKKVQEWYQ